MRGRRVTRLIPFSTALLFALPQAHAAETVNAGTQATNILRVVTHDRNLGKRFGNELTVGVLYLPKHQGSERAAEEMKTAVEANQAVIPGHTVRALKLPYESEDALAGAIRGNRVSVLYVCDELGDAIDAISGVVRKRDVISVGASRDMVAKGLSFGIVSTDGKTKILINVAASRKEGTKFTAQLLKVAETVD